MTNIQSIKEEIRKICTYYSDDPLGGTSGYNLSEDQFQKLFDLFTQALESCRLEEKYIPTEKPKRGRPRRRPIMIVTKVNPFYEGYNFAKQKLDKRIDTYLKK